MVGFMLCFQDAMQMPLQQLLGSWRKDAVPLGLQLVAMAHTLLPKPAFDIPPFNTEAVAVQLRQLAAMPCPEAVAVCHYPPPMRYVFLLKLMCMA